MDLGEEEEQVSLQPKIKPNKKDKKKKEKRKFEQLDEEEDLMEEEDEDFVDRIEEETIEVSFDVAPPNFEKDINGVELFMQHYLTGDVFDYNGMVEALLGDEKNKKPNQISNIIKIPYEVDEKKSEFEWNYDVYGIFSLIDLKKLKKTQFVKEIKNYMLNNCASDKKVFKEVEEILENESCGLIINERVVNLPLQLTPHLHRQLFEDLEKFQDKNEYSKFKNFIIMTKIQEEKEGHLKKEDLKKSKFTPIFFKEEEELYYKKSFLNYHFNLKNQYTEDFSNLNWLCLSKEKKSKEF
eukprot:gene1422-12042_t